jgi:hypothetical protein
MGQPVPELKIGRTNKNSRKPHIHILLLNAKSENGAVDINKEGYD